MFRNEVKKSMNDLMLTSTTVAAQNSGANGFSTMFLLFVLAACVLSVAGTWKMFSKMGTHGFFSLIPIVNVFVLFKYVHGSALKALILIIPVVGGLYTIYTYFKLAKCFGKGFLFGLGLLFLPVIFIPILGFGSAEYEGC